MKVIAAVIKSLTFFVVLFLIVVSTPIGILYLIEPRAIPDNSVAGMVILMLKGM